MTNEDFIVDLLLRMNERGRGLFWLALPEESGLSMADITSIVESQTTANEIRQFLRRFTPEIVGSLVAGFLSSAIMVRLCRLNELA